MKSSLRPLTRFFGVWEVPLSSTCLLLFSIFTEFRLDSMPLKRVRVTVGDIEEIDSIFWKGEGGSKWL